MVPEPATGAINAEQTIYQPSPTARVREQVALYESTDGREGGTLEDRPVVILTTIGATTGNIVHPLRAREVFGAENTRWWQIAEAHWPHFPQYRATAASREIPVMLLEPPQDTTADQQQPPQKNRDPANHGTPQPPATPRDPATKEHHMDRQPTTPGPDHPITIETAGTHIVARAGGHIVADTTTALILREATYPPVYYIPLTDVDQTLLRPSPTTTYCPYKGEASYYSLTTGPDGDIHDAVWTYTNPYPAVAAITGHVAFYPDRVHINTIET